MKNLFGDNRQANILSVLRKNSILTIEALSEKFAVSERTIRNDIKDINLELKNSGLIEINQGKCTLRVFDTRDFQNSYARIIETDDLMNSSTKRQAYLFAKLMRAMEPVLTDEVAYEMNIGRSTLISDLKKLRQTLEDYGLAIVGKTSKGLTLTGPELNIRKFVMENLYDSVYKNYPMDAEIMADIETFLQRENYDADTKRTFRNYVTLMLDRFLTGHVITRLPEKYYNLVLRNSFPFVEELIDCIARDLHIELPIEEKLFVLLPIIGMRTPADSKDMYNIELDEKIRPLLRKIVDQIWQELNVSIDTHEFTEKFLYHLMFMINRLRYNVQIDNPMFEDIHYKYPLAFKMAEIAASVVEKEADVHVTPAELGYLAAYFGVFMETNTLETSTQKVAVVSDKGRVTAQLFAIQIQKVLDSSTELTVLSPQETVSEILDQYDIVICTTEFVLECECPVIYIHEIFDENELKNKLRQAKFWKGTDAMILDDNWFVIANILKEDTFFALSEYTDYEEALGAMIDSLEEKGYVDEEFSDRVWEKEARAKMTIDHIAIPHAVQTARDGIVLAVGIFAKPVSYNNDDIQIIFLLALPEEISDENLLICIYDEIMSLVKDDEMIAKIAGVGSYIELMKVLYKRI